MKILLVFCVLSLITHSVLGQEPDYIHYTTKDGLPNTCIYQMHQDSENNIWFVANPGVVIFDGTSFKNFLDQGDIDGTTFLNIHENQDEQLYFINLDNDTYTYDRVQDRLLRVKFYDSTGTWLRMQHKNLSSFQTKEEGGFKLGFSITQGYVDIKKNGLTRYYHNTLPKGLHIETTEKGCFYYSASGDHLITINGKTDSLINKNSIHLNAVSTANNYTILAQDKQLNLIFNDEVIETKELSKIIIALDVDKQNNVWVSLYRGGTICYEIQGNKLVKKKHLLKKYSVTTALEDHEGGFWFSTVEAGVFYTPNVNIKYYNEDAGLTGSRSTQILGNRKNEVLIGYSNGTLTLFRSDTIYKVFNDFKEQVSNAVTISDINYIESKDHYLISHFGHPTILKDGELITDHYNFITTKNILYDQKEDNFWYTNRNEIGYVQQDTLVYRIPLRNKQKPYRDFNQNTRLYANGDFYVFNKTGNLSIIPFGKSPTNYYLRIADSVMIGTARNSMHIMRPNRDTLVYTTSKKKQFHSPEFDAPNIIWTCTNHGLEKIMINDDTVQSESFYQEIGVINTELRSLYNTEKSLWITSATGLYIIDKTDIKSSVPSAPTVKSITVSDSMYWKPQENLVFQPNENNFTFQLQAITFKYKDQYTFEYQIDQFGDQFESLGGNELKLTNLEWGEYDLNIRIKTVNGIYSPTTTFSFKILPPFWATRWFILISIIVLGLLIYWILKKIIQRVRKQERKKSELKELINSLKLQSIQSQFNPHFTFNAISSIQNHISAKTIDDAKTYLGMFSSIMRAILVNSEKETILISEEVKLLETYLKLEKLRFGNKLDYQFIIDPTVDPEYDRIPPMIMQPILENAINYGIFNKPKGGTLKIYFEVKNDVLYCTIEDDGIGREAARAIQIKKKMKGSGKGLKLVKERLSVANTKIENYFEIVDLFADNGEATGTRIILKIELND